MSTTVVCPSGLSVSIRGMRGKELKVLADRNALKSGAFLDQLFDACVESVIDPGPYKIEGLPKWDDVLTGDRVYLILAIRIATFGETFTFPLVCSHCEVKNEHDVDLSALPIKVLAEEDRAAFRTNSQLTVKYPGTGAKVAFRLGTGADEKRAIRAARTQDAAILDMLARRIDSIENVERVKAYLEEAALGDVMALAKEMNTRDCGVETDIEVSCPDCGFKNEIKIPLGVSFLKPR